MMRTAWLNPVMLLARRWAGAACLAVALLVLNTDTRPASAADQPTGPAILQELKAFNTWGSVLHVAAHPDDENTQLITYLALGRHYRTAYLSITRGDGGQNLLGPEFGEQLGVIRTQELLAARKLDGGRQFFTRAIDFGFSKDVQQTLEFWDRKQVVGDIVRVIRTFRPDVMVTRFSTVPGTTHGHHTASAVLALEAFKLAGDPKAYPEQLATLSVWQPKRIFMNGGGFGPAPAASPASNTIRVDIGGNDPVSGDSFSSIAGRSRAMHKTQGFGNFGGGGGRRGGGAGGPRNESFTLMAGEPATKDILDGVDTTWNRVQGGADIGRLTDNAIASFNPNKPDASLSVLLDIHKRLADLPGDRLLDEKRQLLDRIIQNCLGLAVESIASEAEAVPGEPLKLRHLATAKSAIAVRWSEIRYPKGVTEPSTDAVVMQPEKSATRESTVLLPIGTAITQPYWLREQHAPGMFNVSASDSSLIGMPIAPPAFPIEHLFEVGGQTIVVAVQPVYLTKNKANAEVREALDIIPPVSIGFASDVRLFNPGSDRTIDVELTASRPDAAGTLHLDAPSGWKIVPAGQPFKLSAVGDKQKFTFTATSPPLPTVANISAYVEINGSRYSYRRIEIRYDHIPPQLLQPAARIKAVSADLAIKGKNVGYLPGAGDSAFDALQEMGYAVKPISGDDLTPDRLKAFDAIVIGVRAFNVRTDLASRLPALFSYVETGGTVVEQYNTPGNIKSSPFAPYDIKLSGNLPRNRVTNPNAAITLLAPEHPVFNTPNQITEADFDGWVQERGLNFPNEWDTEHWTALLSCSDAGEPPLKSGLLVAKYGRGCFVYTGLSFFRQLPAGVPGAYRLFANLVSLGK